MNIQQGIEAYIQKTRMGNLDRYDMRMDEIIFLKRLIEVDKPYVALSLAFEYGRAKGYRAARRATR